MYFKISGIMLYLLINVIVQSSTVKGRVNLRQIFGHLDIIFAKI